MNVETGTLEGKNGDDFYLWRTQIGSGREGINVTQGRGESFN